MNTATALTKEDLEYVSDGICPECQMERDKDECPRCGLKVEKCCKCGGRAFVVYLSKCIFWKCNNQVNS